ncbi:MAG: hypothetical protein AAGJ46_10910 [Planctomycetota bacterium]
MAHGLLLAWLLAWLLSGATQSVRGEAGVVFKLPENADRLRKMAVLASPGPPPPWVLDFDSYWPGQFGYRPVRFTLTPAKPSPGKRQVTIQYRVSTYDPSRPELTVEDDFVFPAGAAKETFTLTVPQLFGTEMIAWSVWIDGRLQEDISLDDVTEAMPHVQQSPTGLVALRPSRTSNNPWRGGVLSLLGMAPASGGTALTTSDRPLPDRWLHLTSVDLVVLELEQLASYAESNPPALAALRRWVETGGTLWLERTGDGFAGLAEASELLGIGGGAGEVSRSDSKGPLPDSPEWKWANLRAAEKPTANATGEPSGGGAIVLPPPGVNGTPPTNQQPPRPPAPPAPPLAEVNSTGVFAVAPLGFGLVAGFEDSWNRAANRLAASQRAETQKLAQAYWQRRSWVSRHGLVADVPNASFSNLLPEGVGLPPVNLFRLSVTAFVLIAGPLNFWLLRRYRRSQLSVLTIPLCGMLLTTMLFGYALLSEGFGVTARSRSVTLLDQRRGDLTAWNRACYYAGAPPRGGLVFSDQTAAYPIMPSWSDGVGGSGERQRRLDWAPGEQRMSRGWVGSRQFEQLLVVESRPTEAKLDLRLAGDKLKVKNELASPVSLLLVLDEQGQFWVCEDLGDGDQASLAKADKNAALGKLRVAVAEAQPAFPPGLAEAEDVMWLERGRIRYRGRRSRARDYGALRLNDNLLNQKLVSLTGIDGSPALDLPPRSYVAVTKESGWLDFGVDRVDEEGSFHVVIGRY